MFDIEVIKNNMETIYNQIPDFECKHCHKCCGPIIWFKAEEILMKDYMRKHKIENVKLTDDDFQKNEMKCPFLKNDRCIIYQVRPIVCRLQGNTPDLPCRFNKNNFLSEESIKKIKKDFYELNKKVQGVNIFYSTRKMTKI
jgi:Fe-S-cluster containining protein